MDTVVVTKCFRIPIRQVLHHKSRVVPYVQAWVQSVVDRRDILQVRKSLLLKWVVIATNKPPKVNRRKEREITSSTQSRVRRFTHPQKHPIITVHRNDIRIWRQTSWYSWWWWWCWWESCQHRSSLRHMHRYSNHNHNNWYDGIPHRPNRWDGYTGSHHSNNSNNNKWYEWETLLHHHDSSLCYCNHPWIRHYHS